MHLAKATIFLGVLTIALAAICPRDWKRFGESCYHFITDKAVTWYKANRTCLEKGAGLAIPNSQEEHAFVWQTYKQQLLGKLPSSLWIGCNDIDVEGEWNCPLKGDGKGYENWKDSQSENSPYLANCAFMDYEHDGLWGDRRCKERKYVACERAVNATTNPAYCLHMGSDGRVASRCQVSAGYVIKELPGTGVVSCGKTCRSELRCQSFNLLKQDGGKTVCQLTNATQNYLDIEKVGLSLDCLFFEL